MSGESVNFGFLFFGVSGMVLKYLLHFLIEYGDLETVNTGDMLEASLGVVGKSSGAGG